jgi:predicted kinase
VLDACFPTRSLRAQARAVASERGVPFLLVECRATASVVRRRLRERSVKDASAPPTSDGRDPWVTLYEAFMRGWEPPDEIPPDSLRVVETSRGTPPGRARVQRVLRGADARPSAPAH